MQYAANTPGEYLKMLEDDWRRPKLEAIRALVLRSEPDLQEYIQYKMLAYRLGDTPVFQLNAQKSYVSLYIGDIRKVDPDRTLLVGVNLGKGCIRFSKSTDLQQSGVEQFILKALYLVRQGIDVGC